MKTNFIIINNNKHGLRTDKIYSFFDIFDKLDLFFCVKGYHVSNILIGQYIRKSDIIEMIEI